MLQSELQRYSPPPAPQGPKIKRFKVDQGEARHPAHAAGTYHCRPEVTGPVRGLYMAGEIWVRHRSSPPPSNPPSRAAKTPPRRFLAGERNLTGRARSPGITGLAAACAAAVPASLGGWPASCGFRHAPRRRAGARSRQPARAPIHLAPRPSAACMRRRPRRRARGARARPRAPAAKLADVAAAFAAPCALHTLAIKANPLIGVLRVAVAAGAGLEGLHRGGLHLALRAGCPPTGSS